MEFDLIGHLSPYTVIPTTFDVFEKVLVSEFPSDSSRHTILEGYKRYLTVKRIYSTKFLKKWNTS